MHICDLCQRSFALPVSLNVHRYRAHGIVNDSKPTCSQCYEEFNSYGALSMHRKRKHPGDAAKCQTGELKCGLCPEDSSFSVHEELCQHLEHVHDQLVPVQNLRFDSVADFEVWKDEQAKLGLCTWKTSTNKTKPSGKTYTYYRCHRSGHYDSLAEERMHRSYVTKKMDFECSAFINTKISPETGAVDVKTCVDHYSHDNRLLYLPLPQATVNEIVANLVDERDAKWILKKVQDEARASATLQRQHLLTRKDIRNIIARYGIHQEYRLSDNDAQSVGLKVQDSLDHNNSMFFAYNPLQPDGKFSLGIQTEFQREMMKKFGGEVICVDGTHCTTQYEYKLVTVVVVNEHYKSCPVAHFITPQESAEELRPFFRELRERVGDLKPKYFMSDDAPAFWNEWTAHFDSSDTKQLHCSWHVENNWIKYSTCIADPTLRKTVIGMCSEMMYSRTEPEFRKVMAKLLTELTNNKEEKFKEYLKKHYLKNDETIKLWAFFARAESPLNANMFCEAYHRSLKVNCLNRRQNRRMDYLLSVLEDFSDTCCFEYMRQCEKPEVEGYYRQAELHKRHRRSKNLDQNAVEASVTGEQWKVPSERDPANQYTIKAQNLDCSCQVKCRDCHVYPHSYTCDCEDGFIRGSATACKHAHLVHQKYGQRPATRQYADWNPGEPTTSRAGQDALNLLERVADPGVRDEATVRDLCHAELRKLEELVTSASDPNTLTTLLKQLKRTNKLGTALVGQMPRMDFQPDRIVHPHQNIQNQPRFLSRKKRKTVRVKQRNRAMAREILDGLTEDHCAQCLYDNDTGTGAINWSVCENCDLWYHDLCGPEAGLTETDCNRCRVDARASQDDGNVVPQTDHLYARPADDREVTSVAKNSEKQSKSAVENVGPKKQKLSKNRPEPDDEVASGSPVGVPSARRFYKVDRCAEVQNEQNVSAPSGQCPELVPRVEAVRPIQPDTKSSPEIAESKDAIRVVEKPLSFPFHDQPSKLRVQLKCFTKTVNRLRKQITDVPSDKEFFNKQAQLMATALKRVQLANADLVKNFWGKRVVCPEVKKALAVLKKMQYYQGYDSGAKQETIASFAKSQEILRDPYGTWDAVEGKRLPPAVPWKLPSQFHDHADFFTTPPPKISDYFCTDNTSGRSKTRDRDSNCTVEKSKEKDTETADTCQFGWLSRSDKIQDSKQENEWNQWRERENAERMEKELKREEEWREAQERQHRDEQDRQMEAERQETEWRAREQQRQAERERQEQIAENRRREREREHLEAEAELRRQQRCNAREERELARREYLRAEQERREAMRAEATAREQAAEKERWRDAARSFAAHRRANPTERDWAQSKRRHLDENVSFDPFTSLFSSGNRDDNASTSLVSNRDRDRESSFNPFASLFSSLFAH